MVENTINFAKSLASQVSLFYLPVPYPGSELYKICKKDGGIRENTKWSEFLSIDFDNPIYINPRIGKERMRYWYKRAYVSYYSSLKVWKANLSGLIWNGGIHRCWRGINAVRSLVTHKA